MYHYFVERLARKNFDRINRRDFAPVLRSCAPTLRHRFGGHHALGGTRHRREDFARWLDRLAKVMPDMKLFVTDVWVKGSPANTTVIVRWKNRATLANGTAYENHGVHLLRLRWGTIHEIDANEDSQVVAEGLRVQAAHGIREASLPLIGTADPVINQAA